MSSHTRPHRLQEPHRPTLPLVLVAVLAVTVGPQVATRAEAQTGASAVFAALRKFTSCGKLVTYLQEQTLPKVSPYGLSEVPFIVDDLVVEGPTRGSARPTKTAKTAAGTVVAKAAPQPPVAEASRSNGLAPTPAPAAAPATTAAPAAAPGSFEGASDTRAAPNVTFSNSSTTNTQEVGIDEGDIVENDGRHVYSAVDGRLRVIDTVSGKEVGGIDLPPSNGGEPDLLLDGPRLAITTVLSGRIGPETTVSLYDVSDPTRPSLRGRTHLEGAAIAVRTVDHRARIVVQTPFAQRLGFVSPFDGTPRSIQAALNTNKRVVRRATAADWLPRIIREGADGSSTAPFQALDCRDVGRPPQPSGLGFTWVATLDLNVPSARADARGSAGVITSSSIVYSSGRVLYLATPHNQGFIGGPVPLPNVAGFAAPAQAGPIAVNSRGTAFAPGRVVPNRQPNPETTIHAFDLSPADGANYLASGKIEGSLLNQFSMGEWQGYLRVATTVESAGFGGTSESRIVVLGRLGNQLAEVGRLGGLGRTERIYAVRFVGDLGYVVTFRQTDPLYVVDLRDPRQPKLAGELKIPGFSAYLHPIDTGFLIGIGKDATSQGRILGTQVSLFDVRDPYNPTRLSQLGFGFGQSEAEYDHHAFLWWAPTRSLVVPITSFGQGPGQQPFSGAVVVNVGQAELTEKGRIRHDRPAPPPPPTTPCPLPPAGPPTTILASPPVPAAAGPIVPSPSVAPPIAIVPPPTICLAPTPLPFFPPVPVRRSMIVDNRLVTVSPIGLKVNEIADLKESAWVPFSGGPRP